MCCREGRKKHGIENMENERNQNFGNSVKSAFFHYVVVLIRLFLLLWVLFIAVNLYVIVHGNKEANRVVNRALSQDVNAYLTFLNTFHNNALLDSYVAGGTGKEDVYKLFYDFFRGRTCRALFYVLDSSANILMTNAWQAGPNYLSAGGLHKQFFQSLLGTDDIRGYTSHENRLGYGGIVFTFGKQLRLKDGGSCFVLFELLSDDIVALLSNYEIRTIILKDAYNTVVATNNPSVEDRWGRFAARKTFFIDYVLYETSLEGTALSIVTLTSMAMIRNVIFYGALLILLFSLLILFMMNVLATSVADKLSEPVSKLKKAIAEFEHGNMDYTFELEGNDEFRYLSNQYSELIKKVKNLIEQNAEISNQTRLAEIRQLQAQFDPHFIFNVLQIIYYTNYDDPVKSNQIIELLAGMLRYSIGSKVIQVQMKEDIRYIKTYLELQKIRLEDRLEYDIAVSKPLYECYVPKLILQPLVENCIKYGLHHKEKLSICITGSLRKNIAVIHVKDNGAGIPFRELNVLRSQLDYKTLPPTEHFGLLNTHYRLRLTYGFPYGIQIKSKENLGTDIMLIFPAKREA